MILLTSGTTDVPRRVPATHANVLATCTMRATIRRATPRDQVSQLCTGLFRDGARLDRGIAHHWRECYCRQPL